MVPRQVIKQAIRVRMMGGMMVSYVVVALQQKTRRIAGRLGGGAQVLAAPTSARSAAERDHRRGTLQALAWVGQHRVAAERTLLGRGHHTDAWPPCPETLNTGADLFLSAGRRWREPSPSRLAEVPKRLLAESSLVKLALVKSAYHAL